MKPNIPKLTGRTRTDWSLLTRAFLKPMVLVLGVALMTLFIAAAAKSRSLKDSASERVLMIGDSLSVGKFGEVIGDFLVNTYSAKNVALYASCGSSPEHWLRSEPTFSTRCGYRERSPMQNILIDYDHGRRPRPVATPKLEDLIARNRPSILIVQLGTNWMDNLVSGNPAKEDEIRLYLDRFLAAARQGPRSVRRIIWITPPDSSHFSERVQRTVGGLIKNASTRDKVEIIDSKAMTHYVPGKTGGDGVHYNSEASTHWAQQVIVRLRRKSWSGLY